MVIALSILPVFFIIALGLVGARRGFFPPGFVEPANRLAYWLAIPALIFKAVATAPLDQAFQPLPAAMSVVAIALTWLLAQFLARRLHPGAAGPNPAQASWVQCSIHGNQAFLGLAVVFYALGQEGMNTVGLVAAVIIIAQNLLAVLTLTRLACPIDEHCSPWRALFLNPIIVSSAGGLAWSLSGLPLPGLIERTLSIMGGLGLPLALLIIGAKLSQGKLGDRPLGLAVVSFLKLLALPGLGLLLMGMWRPVDLGATVAVLLLASPTATIAVIMAGQMGGDTQVSAEAVTLTHALSALSYAFWLWLLVG
jgi:predicted permease